MLLGVLVGITCLGNWSARAKTESQLRLRILDSEQERALKPKETFRECVGCPEMVVVPAGSFMMGSIEGKFHDSQHPRHQVVIANQYVVAKYEVTFTEWDLCVSSGSCDGYTPSDEGWGRGSRPVVNVNFDDAQGYVAWLSQITGKRYRLLSEAEYEYAARAGTTTAYPWGGDDSGIPSAQCQIDMVGPSCYSAIGKNNANCQGCGDDDGNGTRTVPVGSYSPNGFGLYDMVGNVWEWASDCLHQNYEGAPTDGKAWIEGGDCYGRMARGGAWSEHPINLRSAMRAAYWKDRRSFDLGFRVARTLTQ